MVTPREDNRFLEMVVSDTHLELQVSDKQDGVCNSQSPESMSSSHVKNLNQNGQPEQSFSLNTFEAATLRPSALTNLREGYENGVMCLKKQQSLYSLEFLGDLEQYVRKVF